MVNLASRNQLPGTIKVKFYDSQISTGQDEEAKVMEGILYNIKFPEEDNNIYMTEYNPTVFLRVCLPYNGGTFRNVELKDIISIGDKEFK